MHYRHTVTQLPRRWHTMDSTQRLHISPLLHLETLWMLHLHMLLKEYSLSSAGVHRPVFSLEAMSLAPMRMT